MELEKSREILRILKTFNPWWETGRIENVEKFRRMDLEATKGRLHDNEIIIIVGARQVGKTTIMEQLIEHVLGEEKPENILFVRADNSGLNAVSKNPIEDSLQVYQEYVLKEEISRINHKIYVLIDEVQKIENWAQTVKSWYDINKKIKFIISGSSSAKIIMDSTKPFVGRAINQIVVPFKFLETIRYDKFTRNEKSENFVLIRNTLRDNLRLVMEKMEITEKDINHIYSGFYDAYKSLIIQENYIKSLLKNYIIKGGYPAVVKDAISKRCIETLTTNYKDVINSDIKATALIRKTQLMESLLVYLARHTSEMLNVGTLSSDLAETGTIITEYIGFLEDTFVISISENFRVGKGNRVRKKIKKVYINDVGLRNVINNSFDDSVLQDGNELGKLVETVVLNHCIRLKFSLTGGTGSDAFYWRENGDEIDIIFECKKHVLPIEVKYRNRIEKSDLKAIYNFVKNNNKAPFGFVVTVDKLEYDKESKIIYVPLWLFLLMV